MKYRTALPSPAAFLRRALGFSLVPFMLACTGQGDAADGSAEVGSPVKGEWIVIHELSDPEGINPLITNDASANAIFSRVYEKLLEQDFVTTELIPGLAEARPTVSEDHRTYTFRLKPGIRFSDGTPLTAKDVVFTFKAVRNPFIIDAAPLRNYYMDLADVVAVDDRTVVCTMAKPYFLAEYFLGGLWILPRHKFDPKGLTDRYTIAETSDPDVAGRNPAIKDFATWYNSPEVKRDFSLNVGTGPYVLDEWKTNESITIRRNDAWWNAGNDEWNPSWPEKLVYRVVNDRNTAVVAVKDQSLDFMEYVPPAKFIEEVDTTSLSHLVKKDFETQAYVYIGWNTARPALADKRIRKALSHLVDRDALIKQVARGLASPINSPIYPQRPEYDKSIPGIRYDVAAAKALIAEAGWSDSDGDGIVDKVIDGKKTNLALTFSINAGNEMREQIGVILAQEFGRVGIKAEVKKIEWTVFLENLRARKFDAYIGSWVNDPIPSDPYQIWHSSQADNKGSNYVGFRNQRVDQLLEMNRTEFDEAKRNEYMREFQSIVVDEQPYTFLWMPRYPAVYNKRLQNVSFSFVRPGYNPTQWWVPKAQWKYAPAQ